MSLADKKTWKLLSRVLQQSVRFQYCVVRVISGQVTFSNIQAFEVRYPFTLDGAFETNDSYLNQLWNICARSNQLLSEDAYVDCADRERAEWMDCAKPAYDVTSVMMSGPPLPGSTTPYWSDPRLLKDMLRRIALTAQPNGMLRALTCTDRADVHNIMEDRTCDWVAYLRRYYDATGDAEFVQEMWPTLLNLMGWFMNARTARGLVFAREWEVWDNPLRYEFCEGAGLNALVYRSLIDAVYLGNAVGNGSDAANFSADASALATAFNSVLWLASAGTYGGAYISSSAYTDPHGLVPSVTLPVGVYPPTVQAALFALQSGIVPAARAASVANWISTNLAGVSQPMSHFYLFDFWYTQHSDFHDFDVLNRMRSAWLPQVASVWGTSVESFPPSGGSYCHVYGEGPGFFLTAYVLGARRVGNIANAAIVIEPRCGGLSSAQGIAVTEFGPVPLSWVNNPDGTFTLSCTVPASVKSATLRLYQRQGSVSLLLNGSLVAAKLNNGFVEYSLSAGAHTVQYPAVSNLTPVNLGAVGNVVAISPAGGAAADGGLDGSGSSYPGNLLGASLQGLGTWFGIGVGGSMNAVSSKSIALPAGSFSTLRFLATGVNGSQTNQTFVVTYSDGTQTSFIQSLSDWSNPQNYNGESIVQSFPYRIAANGSEKAVPSNIYGYVLALNSSKTVSSLTLPNNRNVVVMALSLTPPQTGAKPLGFVPLTPFRAADTRAAGGILAAGSSRSFTIAGLSGIPAGAQAYALNITVLPSGPLSSLSIYPTGRPQPAVSLFSSDGRVKAQAAIVPAGAGGAVTVAVSGQAHVILDVSGYFMPASNSSALAFYTLTPQRLYDTRASGGTLPAGQTRNFAIQAQAGIPSSAQAYSLNVTAIPRATLGNITVWPTGQRIPGVSTLNANTGTVTANAAIVAAGTGGSISVFTTDAVDLIIDINGYFAPQAAGGLSFYSVAPVRIYNSSGAAVSGQLRLPPPSPSAGIPATALAYLMNVTVTPPATFGHLILWPDGSLQPSVSTLNANDGAVTSNTAIVATSNGSIDASAAGSTQLTLDIWGYFGT